MNTEHKPEETPETQAGVNKSRRSFAKVGVAAPVIMTLASRSAFGAICTVSGYISATPGNISAQRHVVSGCGGLSPGGWKTPYAGDGSWAGTSWSPGGADEKLKPEGFGARNTPYGTTMAAAFGYSGFHASMSMYDVLHMDGTQDPYQLGAHLVAALLNAASGQYPSPGGLTVADVQDMYKQLSQSGSYEAAPGVFWTPQDVVSFIQQTFH